MQLENKGELVFEKGLSIPKINEKPFLLDFISCRNLINRLGSNNNLRPFSLLQSWADTDNWKLQF